MLLFSLAIDIKESVCPEGHKFSAKAAGFEFEAFASFVDMRENEHGKIVPCYEVSTSECKYCVISASYQAVIDTAYELIRAEIKNVMEQK